MGFPRVWTLRSGTECTLRLAEAVDAEALIAHVNAVGAEGIYILTERVEKTRDEEREWFRGLDGRTGILLVATVEGRLVGSMDLHRGRPTKSAHVGELGIAVARAFRRAGIGRALLDEGIGWARSVGIRKVFLGVFGSNQPAIALYRSLGFVEEGRLRGQVRLPGGLDDLVLMSRWLDPGGTSFASPPTRAAPPARPEGPGDYLPRRPPRRFG